MIRRWLLCATAGLAFFAAAPAAIAAGGTKLRASDSSFGTMIWAPGDQATYMFDRDKPGRSRCYGACARAWPPVLTKGTPRAGRGLDPGLLGTTKRRNGDRQVTYSGKPLYTYAHEGPNEVLCHDVRLNGGLWWVLGPDGEPLP